MKMQLGNIARTDSHKPVHAYRRKGLDYFCTCTEDLYNELAQKSNTFEVTIFYTEPQPYLKITKEQAQGYVDAATEIIELRAKCAGLESVLNQVLNGTLVDEFNHDDNGLVMLVDRTSSNYIRHQIKKNIAMIQNAIEKVKQ